MPKFRKKPVEVEAVQLKWSTWGEVCEFLGDVVSEQNSGYNIGADEVSDTCGEAGPEYIALKVTTTHGEEAIVRHGDWIIPDSKPGTFYPCKPDVFDATYEAVPVPS
jgi:lipopolysaccharide export system protein LptA